ncbi:MAG: TonB-dependent receptor domain-containing protein [Parcubacteria group bacterium]
MGIGAAPACYAAGAMLPTITRGSEMKRHYSKLLCGAAAAAILASAGIAHAEDKAPVQFDIPAQPLTAALNEFGIQSGSAVLFKADVTGAKVSRAFAGASDPETALMAMLDGTGLSYRREGQAFVIVSASDPQSGSAAGDGADAGTVAALVVTAQKKEENIQDVPIAISAFTEKSLQEQKIEGGFDLLKAIPNVTFSKNNFSSYNFSIRGIGTKAISVTTDPGVAVEFNNSALIRNRLFEQEYFDVERVEVLRGPQGTLHGRNATAGVINVISAKPNMTDFSGWLKGEVGNYHSKRVSAMVNVPLVEDKLAIRLAGALTDRQGYDYNATTKHAINGRDLWSGRITVGFNPTDRIRANLIWERFNEDDNRSRTGKQLCHHDYGPESVGAVTGLLPATRGLLSQGCKPGSLYDDSAFGTPNGLSIPFIAFLSIPGANWGALGLVNPVNGFLPDGHFNQTEASDWVTAVRAVDPYGGMMQSRDLRVINSIKDPKYQAKTDVLELNFDIDVGDHLSVSSQTAYVKDKIYSFQDYNRFNTVPIFNDTSGMFDQNNYSCDYTNPVNPTCLYAPSPLRQLIPGGIYTDPQIGPSNSIAGFDISRARSSQFNQEIRVASSFSGPINFSAGVNYTRYRTLEDYFVMFNMMTLVAQGPSMGVGNLSADVTKCQAHVGMQDAVPPGTLVDVDSPAGAGCIYIDPNPIESINGDGHNYFRSKNPYKLSSSAVFGELYWQPDPVMKVTAGLRYTNDRKTFTPVPSQTLLSSFPNAFGTVDKGYPAEPDIKQHWGELTGRLGLDWTPELTFTDHTLVYGFYSRGYKGGGANPPGIGYSKVGGCFPAWGFCYPELAVFTPPTYPATFEPEFINAYEVGAKNTLLGGAVVLNTAAFFYDYKDYQVSQIKERTAVNENFDAKVWGFEAEAMFSPTRDLRVNATLGYQDSRVANGEQSIDLMDRLQGHTDYMVVKPWVQSASNCVLPKSYVATLIQQARDLNNTLYPEHFLLPKACPWAGAVSALAPDPSTLPNGGAGFYKDLGGNKLPNAPHWTISLGSQYSRDLLDGSWRATVRADAYWQSQSWARVYNDNPYDKLHGWYNANLSVWLERPEDDLKIEFYAKNILDKTPITDAFLNSDDSALTTNVFVLDPRLIGLSIKKGF